MQLQLREMHLARKYSVLATAVPPDLSNVQTEEQRHSQLVGDCLLALITSLSQHVTSSSGAGQRLTGPALQVHTFTAL